MKEDTISNIDDILGKEFRCLDKGFVRLVDVMGDDSSIVQAARVSYGKGTKSVREDRGLIRYLIRHKHTSPFEMVEFKFHVKLPIFVARQWIRHRTASVNEYSGRYSEMTNDFYLPEIEQLRPQSSLNKQGRSDDELPNETTQSIKESMQHSQERLYDDYSNLIEKGLARELARINLPLSNYTEWYWKIDLHNLFHFLRLRLDTHAQYEIRVYGEAIAEIVKSAAPLAYEAFEDYILHGADISKKEIKALKALIGANSITDAELEAIGIKGRELREFKAKFDLS